MVINKQFLIEKRGKEVIVNMRNYSKDFYHWFFQHPDSMKIISYEWIDETLIIRDNNITTIDKLFNSLWLIYLGLH